MSRNGSGVYSPPGSSFPAVANTLIESSKFNNTINDIGTALTESIARDGQTTITANIPMATFKFTGLGAGSAATDSARLGQIQDGSTQWCGTAGGTADALTLTPSPAITAYAAGQRFVFKSSASANTGAATINVSGIGAITLQKNGAALAAGDVGISQWYEIILSSATVAQLQKIGEFSTVSPAFTGTPTAPTAASGTNTTQIATTAFVQDAINGASQVFTSSGTWTKPSAGTYAEVILIGAGGGGGSGKKAASPSYGGGGGGGGGLTRWIFPLSQLSATESVTIGTGGTGGAAVTVNSTDGNDGTAGGDSSFKTLKAGGGGAGGKGAGAGGVGGTAGTGIYAGGAGGDGSSGTGVTATASGLGAGGGGGGGGVNGPTYSSGGSGAASGSGIFASVFAGGTPGNNSTTVATAGTSVSANEPNGGAGAGGGGASLGTAAARTGATGGSYGGGGGGGAGGENSSFDSGAGGNGANGFCVVIVY